MIPIMHAVTGDSPVIHDLLNVHLLPVPTCKTPLLFVDPLVVDETEREDGGWTVEIAQPVKEAANPLMREGTAASGELWDTRWGNTYPTVRYDEHASLYRMWYNSFLHSSKPNASGGTLYATSHDGLAWTKPMSSSITWNGTTQKTNLVLLADADPNREVMFDTHELLCTPRGDAFARARPLLSSRPRHCRAMQEHLRRCTHRILPRHRVIGRHS